MLNIESEIWYRKLHLLKRATLPASPARRTRVSYCTDRPALFHNVHLLLPPPPPRKCRPPPPTPSCTNVSRVRPKGAESTDPSPSSTRRTAIKAIRPLDQQSFSTITRHNFVLLLLGRCRWVPAGELLLRRALLGCVSSPQSCHTTAQIYCSLVQGLLLTAGHGRDIYHSLIQTVLASSLIHALAVSLVCL